MRPAGVGDELVQHLVVFKALRRHAVAGEAAAVGRVEGGETAVGIELGDARQRVFAAHIGYHRVNPFLVEEALVELPVVVYLPEAFVVVDGKVEQQQPIIWHLAHQRLQRLVVPDVAHVSEHPALHHPHGVGVGVGDGAVDLAAEAGQHVVALFGAFGRKDCLHLVERVGDVVVAFSELAFPLLDKHLADAPEQRRAGLQHPVVETAQPRRLGDGGVGEMCLERLRHKAGEGRADGLHTQRAHTVEYLVLQSHLRVVPRPRQGPVYPAEVAHAHPREVSRSGEVGVHLGVAEAKTAEHARGDGLVGNQSQRHIYAVQRHPVYLTLPACPIPVGRGVSEGHHIHIIVMLERRGYRPRLGLRQLGGPVEAVAAPRRYAQPVAAHIVVKSTAGRHASRGTDADTVGPRDYAITVQPIAGFTLHSDAYRNLTPGKPLDDAPCRLSLPRPGSHRRRPGHHRQHRPNTDRPNCRRRMRFIRQISLISQISPISLISPIRPI